jgi:hypothetical protein
VIETREIELEGLEGRRVRIQQLGAKDARGVARRLLNMIGIAIREAAGAAAAGGAEAQVVEIIATGAFLERLDDELIEYLTATFEKVTVIEDTPGSEGWMPITKVRDLVFGAGKGLARWSVWMRACVEFSCGDFFVAVLEQAKEARAQAMSSANGSRTQSGMSGFSTASHRQAATRTA